MYRASVCFALTFALSLCLANQAQAVVTDAKVKTTITLKVLSCPSCAKKVVGKLAEVRGVGDVKTDLKTRSATVTPKANAKLSPRQLWEAVEKAGKIPVKLQGPSGIFRSKPKT